MTETATAFLKTSTLTKTMSSITNCYCLVFSIGEKEIGFFETCVTVSESFNDSVLTYIGEKQPYSEYIRYLFDEAYRRAWMRDHMTTKKYIMNLEENKPTNVYDFLKGLLR